MARFSNPATSGCIWMDTGGRFLLNKGNEIVYTNNNRKREPPAMITVFQKTLSDVAKKSPASLVTILIFRYTSVAAITQAKTCTRVEMANDPIVCLSLT